MTIDEAIEILSACIKGSDEAEPLKFDNAVQLGIGALKEIQHLRKIGAYCYQNPLPGETKE